MDAPQLPASPSLDPLLPAELAWRAEDVGVAKARMSAVQLLTLAVLAGAFIALGAVFSTVALVEAERLPWGASRMLAGLAFSLGLVLVSVGGAELFTGNALIVMSWASRRVTGAALLRNWGLAYLGNLVGALGTALLIRLAGTAAMGGGGFGRTAIEIATAKLALDPVEAVARGVLCNALVCLSVWMTLGARSVVDKVLVIVFPIAAFVAAGFEHSVANMYFVPYALLLTGVAPSSGAFEPSALSWSAFLLRNLLPVTLGNILGGGVLVAAVYWFVYGRPQRRASHTAD